MQPAALVLPAKVKIIVQSLSLIILLKISAALAKSLDVNDIHFIASTILVASIALISICLTGSFNRSFLFMFVMFIMFIPSRIYSLIFYKSIWPPENQALYLSR